MQHPVFLNSFQSMSDLFRGNEHMLFSVAHGCSFCDMTHRDPEFNRVFNEGIASDAQFQMDVLLKDCGHLFQVLECLIDVGGGTGSAAIAVSKAFPEWMLHKWGDQDCVKILQGCKEAIPSKENVGKVIIINLVLGNDTSYQKSRRTQLYFDVLLMVLCGGVEHGEEEWRNMFMEAGFIDYKITPMGLRSVIEVYP